MMAAWSLQATAIHMFSLLHRRKPVLHDDYLCHCYPGSSWVTQVLSASLTGAVRAFRMESATPFCTHTGLEGACLCCMTPHICSCLQL